MFKSGEKVRFQMDNYTSPTQRMVEFLLHYVGYNQYGFLEFQGNIGPVGFLNNLLCLSDDNNKQYGIFKIDYEKQSIWLIKK